MQGKNKPSKETRKRGYSNVGKKCKLLLPIKSIVDKEFTITKADFLGDNIIYKVSRYGKPLIVKENQIEIL